MHHIHSYVGMYTCPGVETGLGHPGYLGQLGNKTSRTDPDFALTVQLDYFDLLMHTLKVETQSC